eukprot:TRINITY_DN11192_c0_g1_i1.p1 TRINITY_DN11192_c0_g1~~TRINITY_DN11192_c0_g1_i1.p1  ORF type:complete len:240 (+),score=44.66 TRINITY_DN11192_c0_g1_i1:70-720(+)
MNNFGIDSLRIVSNRKHPHVTTILANKLATRTGQKILNSSRLYPSLQDAVLDLNVVIGTTRRMRSMEQKELHVEDISSKIMTLDESSNVGFVFGSEKLGLSNEDLSHCNYTLTIPSNSSLNLSVAVALVGYEIWKNRSSSASNIVKVGVPHVKDDPLATQESIKRLEEHIVSNLTPPPVNPSYYSQRLHNILSKPDLTESEVRFLYGLVRSLVQKK